MTYKFLKLPEPNFLSFYGFCKSLLKEEKDKGTPSKALLSCFSQTLQFKHSGTTCRAISPLFFLPTLL